MSPRAYCGRDTGQTAPPSSQKPTPIRGVPEGPPGPGQATGPGLQLLPCGLRPPTTARQDGSSSTGGLLVHQLTTSPFRQTTENFKTAVFCFIDSVARTSAGRGRGKPAGGSRQAFRDRPRREGRQKRAGCWGWSVAASTPSSRGHESQGSMRGGVPLARPLGPWARGPAPATRWLQGRRLSCGSEQDAEHG
nr:uncharacterized protein LOC110150539 isoform X2 [Odocoileus virginianus texanus]